MTIHCIICKEAFTSLVIPQGKALGELGQELSNHITKVHVKATEKLNAEIVQLGVMGMWLLLMERFAQIPNPEQFILDEIKKTKGKLIALMNLDSEVDKEESKLVV
jgi:hypothetical protein